MLATGGQLQCVAAFIDDICNGGKDHPSNIQHLRDLLATIATANFKIGAGKIEVGVDELLAFGFLLRDGTWQPDPACTAPISRLTAPQNCSQLRGFLGLAGYYRMFVRGFASIAKPLSQLLKEDQPWEWGPAQTAAFDELKQRLGSSPVLMMPCPDRPYILYTDFCGLSVSAVLE